MRLTYLNPDDCEQRYQDEVRRAEAFSGQCQSAWYSHAHTLVRLARIAYALGHPLSESQSWFRQATDAYRQLFALRGTTFTRFTRYRDNQPLPEEQVPEDGYTSVDSFNAALVSLTIGNVALARDLVQLAGHSPNAAMVSPQSEVCTTNQQTLSHALNALLESNLELAVREARKMTVRRATRIEQQIALMISALATDGDMLSERDALLFYHQKLAVRSDNQLDCSYWLCLPALGLSFLAVEMGRYELSDLESDSVYCPVAMLTTSDNTGG